MVVDQIEGKEIGVWAYEEVDVQMTELSPLRVKCPPVEVLLLGELGEQE